ncbi:maker280 [Drosophila busckii]|uniref:Mitochondrial import inner membrane translocase subunit n=1 Tax=Drosophila busckii TaxID=30019 RepID=A0A0M3QZ07_DROBS|nr:maker280 [Drosophila busckii]
MEQQRNQLISKLKREIALINTQDLLANVSCKCFEKCVKQPRDNLSTQEQRCIGLCMDRFLESYRVCAHTYAHRLRRASSS